MKKLAIVIFIVMVIGSLMPVLSSAQEIGQICWEFTYGNKTGIWRFQVTQHGNFYEFNGNGSTTDGTYTEEAIMFGNGYIKGNQVKVGLTDIGVDPPYGISDLWWSYGVFIINLSDLGGTFYFIEEDSEPCLPGAPPCEKAVPLVRVTCP